MSGFKNRICFFARYKTELETFSPPSTWSSGQSLVLLCKGMSVQVAPWLYYFFYSAQDTFDVLTRLFVESFGTAIDVHS